MVGATLFATGVAISLNAALTIKRISVNCVPQPDTQLI